MTDKNKKLLIIILSAIVVALAVALTIVLVAQGSKEPENQGTSGPEIGTYYFDSGTQEYTLTLSNGNQFALYIKGATETGSYTLNEKVLTLDFSADGVETLEATLENGVVTLMTYNGATMRMLKKINYTVNFAVDGGSNVEAVQVLNGKSLAKPADPVRNGYVFVGWYTDGEYKTPFAFDAEPITSDITLYARWSEDLLGGAEYSVNLDANYEGAEALAPMMTVGGKLFGLPTLSREGYLFQGWWLSMADNGEKLTGRYEEGMALEPGTTLYALWQSTELGSKLPAPLVQVSAATIRWNAVEGARSYSVTIIDASGFAVVNNEPTSATTFNVAFDTYEAGEYEIRVTALASTGEANNSEAVRYFNNKALGIVSRFEVIDSMLIFNAVEHAEKYLITVTCGNAEHQHTLFDNGNSRTFNFANCEMTEGGIRFVVTAVAEGYGSTTSREFVFCRNLDAVEGLRFDEATQTVYWNEVENADYYMVSVKCGNAAHDHAFHNVGGQTSISLKECDACEGGIQVQVYPKTWGYNSPDAAQLLVTKNVPATPSEVRVQGTVLQWAAVTGAEKYEVMVGEKTFVVNETSYDLSALLNWTEGSEYAISVRAIGSGESAWSDVLNLQYHAMGQSLRYSRNTLRWLPVIGATAYEIQINDGEIITITDGTTSLPVTLTKAGVNVLKVRFLDGANRFDWQTLEVYAHEVTFDTRGGSQVETRYLAVGDEMRLPTTLKNGYDFAAWYNVPGGPSSNGMAYTNELFAGVGDIVLYAHYTPNAYTITYNYGDGGIGEMTKDQVYFETNFQLTVPTPNTPTSAFGGWFSAPYGMGVQYTDPKGNSLQPWPTAANATVYAYWIDSALSFAQTKVSGVDGYIVSAGVQIALLQEVTIPATYNGLPVLMLAGNAFKDCTSLQVINMPASVQQISTISPFAGCTQLQAVNVYPVEGINNPRYWSEDGVLFDNGTALTAQPKLLFLPLAKTGTYRIPNGVSEIPERAFANSLLEKIIVSADVTKIGKEAFADCTKLTAVQFETAAGEKGLTISNRAFKGCTALEKIILPKRLEQINLTRYTIEDNVVDLADTNNSFVGCDSLVSISVASGNKYYKSVDGVLYSGDGKTLLYCPSVKEGEFSIPSGTIAVGPGAFIGCDKLTQITFPNTVTLISECAFYGVSESLEKIVFAGNGYSPVTIDQYAFRGCAALKEVVFEYGSQIATLGEGAFYDCSSLTAFAIPVSMTWIGADAFRNCTSLETITFAANGKTLAFGENAFYNCTGLKVVDLPANVSQIPGIFGGCTSLEAVNVAPDSEYFTSEDGVVFTKDKTQILFFPQGKTGTYSMPLSVNSIASGVFANIKGLKKLTLTTTVTYIGEGAFKNCDISEISFSRGKPVGNLIIAASAFEGASVGKMSLPNHTTEIGEYAFAGTSYTQLNLNEGIITIGDYAFYGAKGTASVTIPASVQTIGNYSFAAIKDGTTVYGAHVSLNAKNSQLTTIGNYAFANNEHVVDTFTIPASVTSIGNYAFSRCKNIGTFTFAGESSLLTIGAHAFEYCGSGSYTMTAITIPKSVTEIGAYAFYNCGYLENVIFEEGGTADLVLGTVYSYTATGSGVATQILEHGRVFDNCMELKSVSLPARLTEIGPYCFHNAAYYNEDGLRVTFGENSRLTTIGAYAFYNSNLKSIVIPKSVQNLDPYVNADLDYSYDRMGIGAYAFAGNYDTLSSVTFEKGGTGALTIGQNAFDNLDVLLTVAFPARLASYTSYTGEVYGPFANGALVFNNADNIQSITVEAGGTGYVDVDGVVYTADMKELVICPAGKTGTVHVPATVTKIQDRAFYGCTKLSGVTFAGGSEPMHIGNEAFKKSTALKQIVLPSNVASIGSSAFAYCTSLESITLSKNLENFEGGMVENCTALQYIHVEEGSGYFRSDSGVLYNADGTTLICYPTSRPDATYTLLPTTKTIGASAFGGNEYIKTVVMPNGLQKIESYAFYECSALKTVMIPNTVDKIDAWAFGYCYALSELSFEMGGTCDMVVGTNAFREISTKDLKLPATMAVINDNAFAYSSIVNLSFESGSKLMSLGNTVFRNTALVTVVLPNSLNKIGDATFIGCASLKNVVFGEGLTSIGNRTFAETSVEMVSFPATLRTMGSETFADCGKLKDVSFAPFAQLESIPQGTFAGSAIERFTVPASVTEISDAVSTRGAFQDCQNLFSITFAEGSKCAEIGMKAFKGCVSLAEFTIPLSVSTLDEYAFEDCESLVSIVIPTGATKLGSGLFSSCSSLTNVVLNTKTTELPGFMFANCTNLTQITIPASVSSMGNSCFANSGLAALNVEEGSVTYSSVDGVLFTADMSQIVVYPGMKRDAVFNVPGTVTYIGADMFADNAYLSELLFEEGEEGLILEEEAIREAKGLVRVHLPERLTSIGEYCFAYCSNLMYINLPTNTTASTIGDNAFNGCSKLFEIYNQSQLVLTAGERDYGGVAEYALNIYTPTEGESKIVMEDNGFVTFERVENGATHVYLVAYNGDASEIVIPAHITDIYDNVFYGMDITKVEIPEGVLSIGMDAFHGCHNLKEVTLPSTLVEIGEKAFIYCDGLVQVVIPSSVKTMGYQAFRYCYTTLFLAETSAKPGGWSEYWVTDTSPVVWGFDGAERIYSFNTNGGTTVAPVASKYAVELPVVTKADHVFVGWYDNAQFTGEPLTGAYYSTTKTTLYAKWMTQAEYDAIAGTSFEEAIEIALGQNVTITIDQAGEYVYLVFNNTGSTAYGYIQCDGTSMQVGADIYTGADPSVNVCYDSINDGPAFYLMSGINYFVIYLADSTATGTFTVTVTT